MYQYKMEKELDKKAKNILSNKSKNPDDLISDLKHINDSFNNKNDVELPKSPDFTKMEDVKIDNEKIKSQAIDELQGFKDSSKTNLKNDFLNKKIELKDNINSLKDTYKDEINNVKSQFEAVKENAKNDALKRGLARSSIVINTLDAFNNKELETYNEIDKKLSKNINAINFELSALNSNYEDALNNFDIEYAAKLSKKINDETNRLKLEQEKVIKYNNEIAEKEADFNRKIVELNEEIKSNNWDKETDYMDLYGKYGALVLDKYKSNKMFDVASNYFNNYSRDEAINVLNGNPELKNLLGEQNIKKLLEKLK